MRSLAPSYSQYGPRAAPVPVTIEIRPIAKAGQSFKKAVWTRHPLLLRPRRCSHRLRRVGKARNAARKSMLQSQVQRAASVFMLLHALPRVVLSRKRARPALTPPSAPLGARIDSPEARPKRAAASRIASYSEANPKTSLFQSAAAHSGGSAQRNPTYSTTQEDDSRAFQPGSTADV